MSEAKSTIERLRQGAVNIRAGIIDSFESDLLEDAADTIVDLLEACKNTSAWLKIMAEMAEAATARTHRTAAERLDTAIAKAERTAEP